MRRLISYIIVAILATAGVTTMAHAEEVLVLLSVKTTGTQELLTTALNAVGSTSVKQVNLAENAEANITQLLRTVRPKVVVALGDKAYRLAMSSPTSRVPVLGALTTEQRNNTISFLAPAEKYLASMKKLGRKSVVMIHSNQTAAYARKAAELAHGYGINIIRRDASSPTEALEIFNSVKGQADALWMLPDANILTPGSAELMLRAALERHITVYAFSKNYLKNGAAVVIEQDRVAIGKVLGDNIRSVLENSYTGLAFRDTFRETDNDSVLDRLRGTKSTFN